MEVISATVFIGAVIVGFTELLKRLNAKDWTGAVIIVVAAVVGALVGVLDVHIGLTDITVAQGALAGLAASGAYQVAKQIG